MSPSLALVRFTLPPCRLSCSACGRALGPERAAYAEVVEDDHEGAILRDDGVAEVWTCIECVDDENLLCGEP